MQADDIVDNDDDTTAIPEQLIRTKGKCRAHLRSNDIYLEIKPRNRSGKCRGCKQLQRNFQSSIKRSGNENPPLVYNTIHIDIWYHVSDHIPPDYVQTFALICRQTANIVNTRRFWKTLYKNYCMKSKNDNNWMLTLPQHLQLHCLRDWDKATMRARVIESLFYTYTPLSERLKKGYALDKLLGCTYVASWHEQENCAWIMCYKFRQKTTITDIKRFNDLTDNFSSDGELEDWESLADYPSCCHEYYVTTQKHINDGVSLLVIQCERFIPFPNQLLYESGESRVALLATRQMLAKDMCGLNLELDFAVASSKVITTVKYPKVVSCKAYPWWHPDFRKYVKLEELMFNS